MKHKTPEEQLKTAILKTLAYTAIFKYPLSKFQICHWLISNHEWKTHAIENALETLVKEDRIKEKSGLYFFKGDQPVNWKFRGEYSKNIIEANISVFKLLSTIPWVTLIAVTGSTAAYNSHPGSDIDVFIVTKKNRLWLTRGFVSCLLKILNKFPSKDGESQKICTNLYVDENNIKWPKSQQNIYTAHEVILMQPMFSRDNTYLRFLKENEWAFMRFPHIPKPEITLIEETSAFNIIDVVEWLAMLVQLVYMHKKHTSEITKKGIIHFKKHDNQTKVLDLYQTTLNSKKIY